jgi:succinate dehydrogenase/fumarate reductase-like Fe-S protein
MESLVATVNGSPIDQKALNAAMQSLAQENFHATLDEIPKSKSINVCASCKECVAGCANSVDIGRRIYELKSMYA